ncbi:hypothetical protein PQX77_021316 [Marasmius sp. AFHP31]|nr:hypothetical protein PQX77_021316 [Marasmius sp. AFHP31]
MNVQDEWHQCLRLQGRAEQQWLRIRGYPEDRIARLVEDRCTFRAETIERYHRMLINKAATRDYMCKTARKYTRRLEDRSYYTRPRRTPELVEEWTRLKAKYEAREEEEGAEVARLQEMIIRLAPPTLILTRRSKVTASSEVQAHVSAMVDIVTKGCDSRDREFS